MLLIVIKNNIMFNKQKRKKGFSMIELMVLIGGIGVLLAVTVSYVDPLKRVGESRDSVRWSDVEKVAQALELYALDNSQIPADFSTPILAVGEKYVICSSDDELTCDEDTNDCLVIDDADFLAYLEELPVDPDKTDASDTGYYIMRKENQGKIAVGACDSYSDNTIEVISRSALSVGCGNGVLEVSLGEKCDSTFSEMCDHPTQVGWGWGDYVSDVDCKAPNDVCSPDCTDCDVACLEEA